MDCLAHFDLQVDAGSRRLLIDRHVIPECEMLSQTAPGHSQVKLVRFGKGYTPLLTSASNPAVNALCGEKSTAVRKAKSGLALLK